MNKHLQNIINIILQDENLSAEQKNGILKSLKDADKELEITNFKLDRTEKVKRTTAILLEETIAELEQKRKAVEDQNRELEIETAVERVRAEAMAMHSTNDFEKVSQQLLKQVKNLNLQGFTGASICLIDENHFMNWWDFSSPGNMGDPKSQTFRYDAKKYKVLGIDVLDKWQQGESYMLLDFDLEKLHAATKEWEEINIDVAHTFKKVISEGKLTHQWNPSGRLSKGFLTFDMLQPPTDDVRKITIKMAHAFNQAYIRFLDLQKAEAQAREAQIEAALEKVRSATNAMHESKHLLQVIKVIGSQLQQLGVKYDTANFSTDYSSVNGINFWTVSPGLQEPLLFHIPTHKIFQLASDALEKGLESFSYILYKEEKDDWLDHLFKNTIFREYPEELKRKRYDADGMATSMVLLSKTTILSVARYKAKPYSEETNNLIKRFGQAFQQTYTRFLDLQKAEAQAREAQIETAVERVRSRSLAMHKSEELREVIAVVFEKLKELNFNMEHRAAIINIYSEGSKEFTEWITDPGQTYPTSFVIPDLPFDNLTHVWEARAKAIDFTSRIIYKKEKNPFFDYLFEHTGYKYLPEEIKKGMLETEYYIYSIALGKNSGISLPDLSGRQMTESEIDILKRFAKVFDQAYTRFLDLQKVEAQARESQIQLALERVRARTMAMQRSEELPEVAALLFQQVKTLGVPQFHCGFNIFEIDDKECIWYPGSADGDILPPCKIPLTEHPVFMNFIESRKRGDELCVYEKEGEYQAGHYRYMLSLPVLGEILQNMLDAGIPFPTFQIDHLANFSHGNLLFITSEHFPEMHDTFKRFAKVFEQTYTRFLDLQKAEAQAREAQIEAALERVRSRSMGMQKSDELRIVVQEIYEQFVHLGIDIFGSDFRMDYRDREDWHIWSADRINSFPSQLYIPYFDHPYWNAWNDAKRKGVDALTYTMGLEEKNSFVLGLSKHIPDISAEGLAIVLNTPGYSVSNVFLQHIALSIDRFKPEPFADADNAILMRFAKVFEQTYIRFLDLQKAEAQAREAIIEASLEKVRGKAMAMHNSNDLLVTASEVFTELRKLGITPIRCGVGLLNANSKSANLYQSISSEQGDKFIFAGTVPLEGHPVIDDIYDCASRGEPCFPVLRGELIRTYYQNVLSSSQIPDLHPDYTEYGYFISFTEGFFFGWSRRPIAEGEIKILNRFKIIIDLTFRRYIELQQAEANALEALRSASLDRVRAQIASMRTTSDLDRIQPLLWNELKTLGVPFIRCGVHIINESNQEIHSFLSTPDGKSIASFRLAYFATRLSTNIVNHWHQKLLYKDHMDEAAFAEYTKNLVQQGAVASDEKYVTENRPTDLYLHFIPFLQGMLYVGNDTPLKEEELQLVQTLADAFSTAYARYEDFNKLETAKQQVEKTLVELKQTQAQLVQSEKMASLGELTAGIAHEIQNPLNFVNNFSEVNTELIKEIQDERTKTQDNRDESLENDLLKDISLNQEKINHHGKRAADIVKGMLQHSRSSSGVKEPTDINALADEYLRLAYHGLRAKDKSFNATLNTDYDPTIGNINIIPQDIGRVILNLINNAFYVVNEKSKQNIAGYEPTVSVSTKKDGNRVLISVKDNGNGIPQQILDKIFQPFFTTKPTGQGTGLGLSLSYDIVKAHGGELKVVTNFGEGSDFTIQLPAFI